MATESFVNVVEESANPVAGATWSGDTSPVHVLRAVANRWKTWGVWISGAALVLACASVIAMVVGMARTPSQQVDQVFVPATVAKEYLSTVTNPYRSEVVTLSGVAADRILSNVTLIAVGVVVLGVVIGFFLLTSGAVEPDAVLPRLGKLILPLVLICGAAYMLGPFLRTGESPRPKPEGLAKASISRMQQDLLNDSFSVPRPDLLFVASQHALASNRPPSDVERLWVEEMAEMFVAGRVNYPDALASQYAIEASAYGSPRSTAARMYGADALVSAKRADDLSWKLWAIAAAFLLAGCVAWGGWTLVTRRVRRVEALLTDLHQLQSGDEVDR